MDYYTAETYRVWLETNAKQIMSEFSESNDPHWPSAIRRIVARADLDSTPGALNMVLENTKNEPRESDINKEFGALGSWKRVKLNCAILAARGDLKEAVLAEDKARREIIEKKKAEVKLHRRQKISVAAKLLPLALAHAHRDEYVKGAYERDRENSGQRFKGCSIGCTIYDAKVLGLLPVDTDIDDHNAVAGLLFGGVRQLALLQDAIFETLPDSASIQWTPKLLDAVTSAPSRTNWTHVYRRWIAGVMGSMLRTAYVKDDQFLYMATERARVLHALMADGHMVCEDDLDDAREAAERWSERGNMRAGSSPEHAYEAVIAATETTHHGEDILHAAYGAGVEYERMADILIGAIPIK